MSDPAMTPMHAGALALLLACAVASDLRSRRIPNVLTGTFAAAGVALSALAHGPGGALLALTGAALAALILVVPCSLGGVGGGDVKMMAAAGTLLGPALVVIALGAGFVAGGLAAVVAAARRGRLRATLGRTWAMAAGAVITGSAAPLRSPVQAPDAIFLPYSIPLAIGTAATVGWAMLARA